MTKRFASAKSNYLPVAFRLYHLWSYGEHKGQPNPATFTTLQLDRCIDPQFPGEQYESVKNTIDRLKTMLKQSDVRWTILACEESEGERASRRKADGVEVVKVGTPTKEYDPLNGDETDASPTSAVVDQDIPIMAEQSMSMRVRKAVDDEDVGVRKDTGRISSKRKAKAEAAVAA